MMVTNWVLLTFNTFFMVYETYLFINTSNVVYLLIAMFNSYAAFTCVGRLCQKGM